MRIAVVGATGNIGSRVVGLLGSAGHEPVAISRSVGVDVISGAGLAEALDGCEVVVDASSFLTDPEESFATATRNLLAAEADAGVRHHVALSIVGVERVDGNPHYAGKRAQEALIEAGPVPWSILQATQFHDFPLMMADRQRRGDEVRLIPRVMQPVDPDEVAAYLVEVAVAAPRGRVELAGPRIEELIDLARRSLAARGDTVTVVPVDVEQAPPRDALLPGPESRIGTVTFDEWLAAQRP